MNFFSLRHPVFLGILSGVLLAAAYRVPGAWPLTFIALVPLLFAAERASSISRALIAGAIAGICLMFVSAVWLFSILPLSAAFEVHSSQLAFWFVSINVAAMLAVTGIWMGVWSALAWLMRPLRFLHALTLSFAWVLLEFIRMDAFGFGASFPGVQNPSFFSAGFLGYPLADSASWLQLASLGGVAVLSMTAVAVNFGIFFLLRCEWNLRRIVVGSVFIFGIALVSFLPIADWRRSETGEGHTPHVSIAFVSLDTPTRTPTVDFTQFDAGTARVVAEADAAGADIILLPEDSRLLFPFSRRNAASVLAPGSHAVIVDSGVFVDEKGNRPFRAYADSISGAATVRDKWILTPEGEYLVPFFRAFLGLVGAGDAANHFDMLRNYSPGGMGGPVKAQGIRASVLFCLEVMRPGFGALLARAQKSDFLFVISSHVWFHNSAALEQDSLRFHRVESVEAGVPTVVSSDGSSAYALDRYGFVLASTEPDANRQFGIITF